MTESEPLKAKRQPGMLWTSVIVLVTVGVSGGVAGYFDSHAKASGTEQSGAMISGLVLLIGLGILAAYLSRFGRFWTNWTKRKRLYAVSMILAVALGVVSGIALQFDSGRGSDSGLFGNGALDPGIAITLSAIWLGGMALSIALYHRSVDDHEKQAYLWGGLAGFYAVVFPAPAWWLLARADLAPPVDGMTLFLLSMAANAIVYFWLKYR